LDKLYTALKLEGEEKEKVFFQARLDTFQGSPNASKLLDKEKMDLRRQIELIKQDVTQYENNLGFFKNSKGANAMKEEVEKKIAQSKRKIEEITRKIKMIPSELTKS
jgi:archaellum component FlaC